MITTAGGRVGRSAVGGGRSTRYGSSSPPGCTSGRIRLSFRPGALPACGRPTIEYGLPDGGTAELVHREERPGGGYYQVGDEATVLYRPSRPGRAVAVHPVERLPPPPGPVGLVASAMVCGLVAFGLLVQVF
ncbi:DUF3592 domain-containing protein [Streptomyces sp. FH025]|uniref:DUF3592 domain-containing protein n=1 Tax=Streptomyces sp. FH025 TaxID=2815937 RepID=UPI001A9DF6E3|nr:DUF3592 domain-containing protein [Streptomyces sp. FH025]MBO1415039.1 hypothetical protein [Streptomyces sp. FH025]